MIIDRIWMKSPARLSLSTDDVHICFTTTEVTPGEIEYARSFLSTDELDRALRFHFEQDKIRHIVAHGVLRILLGMYYNISPTEFTFSSNPYGKLSVNQLYNGNQMHFNLTHSGKVVLYAFTVNREVGIDVEEIWPMDSGIQIAERFFSEEENIILRSFPAAAQDRAFFTCWTRKEAYIKARGKGLSIPLDDFTVSFKPGEKPGLLNVKNDREELKRWFFSEIPINKEYVAAVAVEGRDFTLKYFNFSHADDQTAGSNIQRFHS